MPEVVERGLPVWVGDERNEPGEALFVECRVDLVLALQAVLRATINSVNEGAQSPCEPGGAGSVRMQPHARVNSEIQSMSSTSNQLKLPIATCPNLPRPSGTTAARSRTPWPPPPSFLVGTRPRQARCRTAGRARRAVRTGGSAWRDCVRRARVSTMLAAHPDTHTPLAQPVSLSRSCSTGGGCSSAESLVYA